MRCSALQLLLPLIVAACGTTQETSALAVPTAVTSAELPVAKESPRATHRSAATAERDACAAYADCIDEAPPPDPNEGGMHASSATIRSWERSAEQLRQCAVAHDLARAGGLCR
jgi:hypothetical protein